MPYFHLISYYIFIAALHAFIIHTFYAPKKSIYFLSLATSLAGIILSTVFIQLFFEAFITSFFWEYIFPVLGATLCNGLLLFSLRRQ